MFELDYYTIEELATKLEKILSTPVTPKDILHRGIQGKLPIYICPNTLAQNNKNGGRDIAFAEVERGELDYDDNGKFIHIPTYLGRPNEFERLYELDLKELDKNNIYQAGTSVDIHRTWVDETSYSLMRMTFFCEEASRGIPVSLSDLYVLADDVREIEAECKAKLEKPLNQSNKRESSKPYILINQLITMLLPDADLNKPFQVYDALNRKLKGNEKLAVSKDTLKMYLEKL